MNEIVQYQNEMNKLKFKGFTQTSMNMFMALCSQMKNKNTEEIVMSYDQIKKLVKYDEKKKSKEVFERDLELMNEQLMSVNCRIIMGPKRKMFVLFPTFTIDTENETLTVAVNKDFTWLLNEMKSYTTFELAEFIDLKSKYSKNLYRLLKQWRTVGKYTFHNLTEFRELMDIPKSYSNKYMMDECVNVAIEEISRSDGSFKGFRCEPIYAMKRGKPLDKLVFTWDAEEKKVYPEPDRDGQYGFSDPESYDRYQEICGVKDKAHPSPVAIKIAQDIEKGRKKPKTGSGGKPSKFHNYTQRDYSKRYYELMEMKSQRELFGESLTPEEESELIEESRKASAHE